MHPKTPVTCVVCKREVSRSRCSPVRSLRPVLAELLRKDHPDASPDGFICLPDMNRLRSDYVEDTLTSGKRALSRMEAEVLESIQKEELLARELMQDNLDGLTLGQRLADAVARFGGSWAFLISFALFLAFWIAVNAAAAWLFRGRAFDPYPFILLNLILSCLAAVQAPIIMMSQNRQEARDRKRAENDYQVNLKAELEIRNLHEKMDHLLEHQWQYLMDIQQVQVELMEELARRKQ